MALHGKKFRTKLEREMHLAEVAKLYLSGMAKFQIAERTGVAKSMITYDLKMLLKQWQQQALQATGEVKARELAKLDQIEAEAWAAWERSLRPRETTNQKRKTKSDGNAASTAGRTENQSVIHCMERRSALLGLDAPEQIHVSGELLALTNAERAQMIVEILETARARVAAGDEEH